VRGERGRRVVVVGETDGAIVIAVCGRGACRGKEAGNRWLKASTLGEWVVVAGVGSRLDRSHGDVDC